MVVTGQKEAGWASKGARKSFNEAGRALEAIKRVSKTARKASEAAGRASEAAGGYVGGAKNETGLMLK